MLLPAQQSGDNAAEGVAYCGGDHAYAQDFQSLQDRGLADQPTLDGPEGEEANQRGGDGHGNGHIPRQEQVGDDGHKGGLMKDSPMTSASLTGLVVSSKLIPSSFSAIVRSHRSLS